MIKLYYPSDLIDKLVISMNTNIPYFMFKSVCAEKLLARSRSLKYSGDIFGSANEDYVYRMWISLYPILN